MEYNRSNAFRYIQISKLCIKNKNFEKAWEYSVKANKMFPTAITKRELHLYCNILLEMYIFYEGCPKNKVLEAL